MTEMPSTDNREDPATLAIVLDGPGVQLGMIAARTVSRYIDALRLGLQAIVELSDSATASEIDSPGRRQRWVERIAAIRLVGIESGSVRIRFAEPAWCGLFADSERETYTRALDLLHLVATWASNESVTTSQLPHELSSLAPEHRRRLLEIVYRLTPPRRGPVRTVTIERHPRLDESTRSLTATLNRDARARIRAEIDRMESRCGDTTDANTDRPTSEPDDAPLLKFGHFESASPEHPPPTTAQNPHSD